MSEKLPTGVTEIEEGGHAYYFYKKTGFKTPHLVRMERYVAKRTPAQKAGKDGK